MNEVWFEALGVDITYGAALIPVFAGVIGMFTNWVAIKMMFLPLEWVGWRAPFKVGIGRYKFPVFGWQGVIPSKAAKMGSLSVDTGLTKLGTMSEFYHTFEPAVMAAHIVETSRDDIRDLVEQIAREQYPELWAAAPAQVRAAIHRRVAAETPRLVRQVLDNIGDNIDRLVDLKLMVVRFLESNPKLLNTIFLEVGHKEFRFIVNSGLWLGVLLGLAIPLPAYLVAPDVTWTVPVGGAIVGYLTNWIALKVIFQPMRPRRIGPFTLYGLFLKRQDEVAEAYSEIIAYKVVTLPNIADQMINGPDADRTRRLISDTVGPLVDEAVGAARPLVRATARGRWSDVKEDIAVTAVESTADVLLDETYALDRAKGMQRLLAERMRQLSPPEFAQMLRSAFEQDEWMLIAVGAVLGLAAGAVQVALTLGGA